MPLNISQPPWVRWASIEARAVDLYDNRLAAGDSTTEALRALKRRLARVVHNDYRKQPVDRCRSAAPGCGLT